MFLLNSIIFTWLKIQKVKRVSMRRLFYPCPLAPPECLLVVVATALGSWMTCRAVSALACCLLVLACRHVLYMVTNYMKNILYSVVFKYLHFFLGYT